jgi:5,10-methenyltetrahydrofolate synthetase
LTPEQRHEAAHKIAAGLDGHCARHQPAWVGLYWPIKYEPNLLAWARGSASNLRFCLPVVVTRGHPLEYWRWTPGDAMQSGVWGIQVPARREVVAPDLMIAPLVDFDRDRYRLGNGGGYFDRTLAARFQLAGSITYTDHELSVRTSPDRLRTGRIGRTGLAHR